MPAALLIFTLPYLRDLGLFPLFQSNNDVRENVHKIFCLPYLPFDHIQRQFDKITEEGIPELKPLYSYIQNNWMDGSYWSPASWSVFNKKIRTNNDAEGLHNLWNRRAKSNMNFYQLNKYLYDESTDIPRQITMIAHDKLHREQRAATKRKDEFMDSICSRS